MKPYPARSVFMTNLHRVQASLGSRIFACVVLSCALFSTQVAGQTDEDDSLNQMFLDYGLPNPLRPDRQRPVDQRLIQIEKQGIAGSGLFPGQVYVAHNAAEVQALSNTLSPGDQLVLSASGNWVDALFTFQGHGTYAAPILIRGETPGGVVFTGHSRLYFHGENLVVMDFKLQNVQVAGSGTTLLNLGAGGIEASDSILDRVEIVDCNSPNPADWPVVRMFYAQVRGPRNTVANCTFSGMKHYGQMLTAENLPVGELQQLHVLNNHFVNRPHIDEQNGYEIIQIGWSGEYAASSGSLLQGNIFENCAGENETISLKASDIYVRDNQFLGCQGVLSLRVAGRVLIQNNIFDGSGINNTGGVRLAGAGHVVVGNTFTDLRQPANYYSWPVSLMAASAEEASSDIDGYGRAKNILIAHNLFDRNDRRIAVGIYPSATYPLLPENVQIRDNTFTFNDATTAVDYTAPDLPAGAVTEAGNGFSPPDAAPWVPTYLTATDIAGNVVLSWTSSLGATGYELERAATSSGPFTLIGSASGPYYTDDTVSGGQTYYYRVTAANSFGSSPASAEVGITLPLTTKTVLLDDDFSDNDRTTQNLPTSAAWFSSTSTSAGRLLVDDGALELNVGTQVGTQTVAYFADAAGNPAELADIGDSLVVRFTSKYTRTAEADTTSGFRFGLLSSEGGPRQTADSVSGSTLWDTYRGYAILHGSNSAISGRERKTTGVASNSYLLNGLGNYNSLSATQTATVSLQPAVTYQGTLILTRTSTGLDIFYSLVDPSNPANAWTYRTSDSSPNTYRYDTLAFSDENLFTQTIDNVEVTLLTSINSVPRIQTTALPEGAVGFAYSQTLTATGGDGALLWSAAAGALPAGLTLSSDGVISGVPTATGTSSVTLRLQDTDDFNDASDEDTRELSITVVSGTAPSAPTDLTVTDLVGDTVLAWTPSSGATGYTVERAATSSGPFTLIGSTSVPYYTDESAAGGQTFYYRVTASNGFGDSPASVEAGIALSPVAKTVLLDDDFSDNDRTTQNLPTSAAWLSSTSTSAGRLLVDDGALELNVGTQVGTQTVAYFADAAGNPAELADIGDSLVVRFTSKYTRTAAADTTSGFRFGLLSSEGGPRQTADSVSGSTLWDTYRGYAILHGSNSAISGWERKTTGVTSNSYLLNGLGNYTTLSATQTATVSLQPTVTYQGTAILTRTATGLDIFYSLVDPSNPANAWTYRTSDSSPNTYRYDTLAFSDENLFTQTIDNIEVTLRVPNPSSPNSVPHIQTVSLPDGTVGVAYSQTLTATDGDGTLLWSVAAGSLPAGLTLSSDGVISGVPTATGTSSVTLRLQDTDDFNDASDKDTRELSIAIAPGAAAITLDQLSAVYDGASKSVTATTIPAGLAVNITYNDSATAPTNAGSYAVAATIADPNYVGSASDTLVISPAIATVALGNLTQAYDGTPRNAIVTTQPSGVAVAVTYDGGLTVPTNAGSYTVAAAVIDPNYTGSTSGTFTISQASAAITLARLRRAYDGTPKIAAAVTVPAGLAVELTYDGQSEPPTLPGSYAIAATIDDPNYAGSVSGTLVIASTALVRHAPTLNGNIDGSVQVLLAENITLNGGATIDGDLLVPGTPAVTVNGNALYAGVQDGPGAAAAAQYHVILNGNVVLRYLVRRVDPIELPVVDTPPPPAGTVNLTLNDSSQGVSNWSAIRNLTLNGNVGVRAAPPDTYGNLTANGSSGFILGIPGSTEPAIYNLQGLTLNSGSQLQIVGPVILTLAHGSSFQGAVGNSDHPEWLQLRIASGDLTLNGNAVLHGEVAAPDGTVTINGNAALHGTVSADRFILNGNGLLSEITTQ